MAIYKKLLLLQQAMKGFKKDAQGQNYQYVSGTKVLNNIREHMDSLGLILKTEVIGIQNQRQDYTVGHGKPSQRIKEEVLTTLKLRFTWVDVETGETDVNLFAANGQNDWDKGFGSAITYGERYFLLKYFHIPTDEDDVDKPKQYDEDGKELPPPPPPKKKISKPALDGACKRIREGETDLYQKMIDTYDLEESSKKALLDAFSQATPKK